MTVARKTRAIMAHRFRPWEAWEVKLILYRIGLAPWSAHAGGAVDILKADRGVGRGPGGPPHFHDAIHYHRGSYETPQLYDRPGVRPVLMPLRIAVLGAGNMGAALIGGIVNRVAPAGQVIATTRTAERAAAVAGKYGITVTAGGNREAAERSDLIVLAVKPGTLPKVVTEIRDALSDQKILLSLAASASIGMIEKLVGKRM